LVTGSTKLSPERNHCSSVLKKALPLKPVSYIINVAQADTRLYVRTFLLVAKGILKIPSWRVGNQKSRL